MSEIKVVIRKKIEKKKFCISIPSGVVLDGLVDKNGVIYVKYPQNPDLIVGVSEKNLMCSSLDDEDTIEEMLRMEDENVRRKTNLYNF